jgi:pimeloyl-ACP methyl ester carboxylesterase
MPFIKVKDGAEIFYKDWGAHDAQAIVFHHGWPLSADDWDNQMILHGDDDQIVPYADSAPLSVKLLRKAR